MKCPSCRSDAMNQETWNEVISHQGKSVTLHAVSGHRCSECGAALYDDESSDRIEAASDDLAKAKSNIKPHDALGGKGK
jgi:YgiT-type zinc finger domain-containing protein